MNSRTFIALLLVLCRSVNGQGLINTVAGGSGYLDGIGALKARLDGAQAVAVDQFGNAFIGDGERIRRVDASTGLIVTVAGNGGLSVLEDGPATQVSLSGPSNFTFDPSGRLLFIDDDRVLRLDLKSATLTTLAGTPDVTTTQFGIISGLATDASGNIFVTDEDGRILRIDSATKAVTLVAGNGGIAGTTVPDGDGGPATMAALGRPGPIALDPSGNIYFAEQFWLRRIDGKSGIITTIAPITSYALTQAGPIAKAVFANVFELRADEAGHLVLQTAQGSGKSIFKIAW